MERSLLILGGSGFIGSNLADRALKEGYETHIFFNNYSSLRNKIEGAIYTQVDLTNLELLREKIPQDLDYLVNLSGYIDHSPFSNGGSQIIDTHLGGTINLLKATNWKRLKRFVQIGSSDEYGGNLSPLNEDLPAAPISPYAFSKSASIELLKMLHKTESFPSVMLRLFLVFGPRQDSKDFYLN